MSINRSDDKNIPADTEARSQMGDLVVGDRIELIYEDNPQNVIRATVSRILTDEDECMGPEIEDYVACWFEIEMASVEGEGAEQFSLRADAWKRTVTFSTDFKYSLDGRRVAVRKY